MRPIQHRILPKSHQAVRHELEVIQAQVTPASTLHLEDKGKAVLLLKKHLHDAGLGGMDLKSDLFGAGTLNAVKAFQKASQLTQTGEVDSATLKKLSSLDLFVDQGFKTTAGQGQRGADIAAMETRLSQLHFKVGKRDGIFDSTLAKAVKRFQRQQGLQPSGKIGTGTSAHAKEALKVERRLANSPKLRLVHDLAIRAKKLGIPAELPIITALVESNFTNVAGGDRDSVGMFQQRAAWGPFAIRHDPRKSAELFFNGGLGGQRGAVDFKSRFKSQGPSAYGAWAQAVQVSAFPGRYQQRLAEARRLLRQAGVKLGLK
jgi:peptidoglycan hydrolase-like protein with peptidoglycan-binding domain